MSTYSIYNIKVDNNLSFTPGPTAGWVLSINADGSTSWIRPNVSGDIVSYEITFITDNGYPSSISNASSSYGEILHNGATWISPGWSNDTIGNSGNNYLITIYHPTATRVLNLMTHGLNSGNIYSISVYGKSTAGTQYCTVIQPSSFAYFSIYGLSYMSTACAQTGFSEVVVTFQLQM